MRPTAAALLGLCAGSAIAPAAVSGQTAPILLAVESLEADMTGEVNVIVRSAVAAPLSSGSLRLEARDRDGNVAAFAALVSATAFATAGDATAAAVLDPVAQTVDVSFASASATLNEAIGPLLVVRLQLAAGLQLDERFDLRLVPGSIELLSPLAEPLPALGERGRLRLRPADPGGADIGPLGGEVAPGDVLVLGAATGRPFPIASGTVEILFDPLVASAPPTFTLDPRYGSVVVDSLAEPEPGRLVVTFHSPDEDLNADLHGLLFALALPTLPDVPVGTLAALSLGPATQLFGPGGAPLVVELGDTDVVEFVPAGLVLRTGFEDGDLFDWTLEN